MIRIKVAILLMIMLIQVFPALAGVFTSCCDDEQSLQLIDDQEIADDGCKDLSNLPQQDNECCGDDCACCVAVKVITTYYPKTKSSNQQVYQKTENHYYKGMLDHLYVTKLFQPPSAH